MYKRHPVAYTYLKAKKTWFKLVGSAGRAFGQKHTFQPFERRV